jgi:hypothetical protein
MTTPPRACLPLELPGGGAVRVPLADEVAFVVVENETHRPLDARVSVDPRTRTVTIVVGEAPGVAPRSGE